eukprot:INCI8191.1.p1 GENE.INCI8191.1~~INCI8191.1.p1  ORF type:complete len:330 (-),score=45.23 INCI8191.1:296-1285(-)
MKLLGAPVSVTRCTATGDNGPVVCLFGWMLAEDRTLKKYADIFADSFDTIRVTAPLSAVYRQSQASEFVRQFLKFICAPECRNRRVVIMCFSNGGCFMLERLNYFARNCSIDKGRAGVPESAVARFFQERLVACILDSCPGDLDIGAGFRAFTSSGIVQKNTIARWVAKFGVPSVLAVVVFSWFRSLVKAVLGQKIVYASFLFACGILPVLVRLNRRRRSDRYFSSLTCRAIPGPWLFLYGAADDLCRVDAIERAIAMRRQAGFPVHHQKWEDSGHVSHFRTHPNEYLATIRNFLAEYVSKPLTGSCYQELRAGPFQPNKSAPRQCDSL